LSKFQKTWISPEELRLRHLRRGFSPISVVLLGKRKRLWTDSRVKGTGDCWHPRGHGENTVKRATLGFLFQAWAVRTPLITLLSRGVDLWLKSEISWSQQLKTIITGKSGDGIYVSEKGTVQQAVE
ncbi:hypothetical protein J0S82_016690, partial [Galemys pyrenaicus]